VSIQDRRYGQNKNLWRKVYGYSGTKPNITQIIDSQTNTTYSVDANSILRHRDYYEIRGPYESVYMSGAYVIGEYDEGLIPFTMNGDTFASFNFSFSFSGRPYVVFTVDPNGQNQENIIAYGISVSTSGAYMGISAPYSGNIRYRAVNAPSYPAICSSSYSSAFTCSAGSAVVVNDTFYTANFTPMAGVNFFLQTPWDFNNTNTSDVYLSASNITNGLVDTYISADYNNYIDFIAYS